MKRETINYTAVGVFVLLMLAAFFALLLAITGPGGGAFLDPQTRARIKSSAVSVWIKAPLELLLERVGRRDNRPLLREGDPRQVLEKLLAVRAPIYAEADIEVESEDGPHGAQVGRLLAALEEMGVLEAT